jgi:phospholipase/carboxylesterase
VDDAQSGFAHVVRPAGGVARGALVLLHGRGADEHDLLPLLDALDPGRRLVGVTVRAPLALPPGGWHWYAFRQLGYPDPETFRETYARLAPWLDRLPLELGIDPSRLVIGGFSQGAVMSYAMTLGPGRPKPAGLLAMSGFMPAVEGFPLEPAELRGVPVAITHGTLDPVIPVDFGREARDRFEAAGVTVQYRETPVGHGIDPRLLPELVTWLGDVLPEPAAA